MLMEIRAAEGGTDAELFASQLADAISKFSGATVETVGTVYKLHRL